MLEPVYGFAVELFLNGDVRHGRCLRCSVPVLFSGFEPEDVARADLFDWAAPALRAAAAGCDNERLAERVRMPGCAGSGFEGDAGADYACWVGRGKQRIDPDGAGEPLGRPFAGWLGATSL